MKKIPNEVTNILYLTTILFIATAIIWKKPIKNNPLINDIAISNQTAGKNDEVPSKSPAEALIAKTVRESKEVWIAAHGAGIKKTEKYDEATDNLITEITIGAEILRISSEGGRVGDKRLRYKYDLRSVAGPLLLGNSSTRHQKELGIFSLTTQEGKHYREVEVTFSIPNSSPSGGFAFYRDQTELSSIGFLVPDFTIPANESPGSADWNMIVRIYKDMTFHSELGPEQILQLAKRMKPEEIVQLHPDSSDTDSQEPLVLWFSISKSGAFTLPTP